MRLSFPFLKSRAIPYGAVEQFGMAVTVDPDTDGSPDPSFSWFGRTLDTNSFVMSYTANGQTDYIRGHASITVAYARKELRYTAYDWKLTSLSIDDAAGTGDVAGTVNIKGRCAGCTQNPNHEGAHRFQYKIFKGADNNWRVREWKLEKV